MTEVLLCLNLKIALLLKSLKYLRSNCCPGNTLWHLIKSCMSDWYFNEWDIRTRFHQSDQLRGWISRDAIILLSTLHKGTSCAPRVDAFALSDVQR